MIHEYFKKETEDFKILVQLNPESFHGLELIVLPDNSIQKTKRVFDEDIYDDLAADEFEECSPLEFNLNLKGIF
ncbi:MAG: hypothetical protein AAFQ94_22685 [Bacteroidota bacterium]